MILLGTVFRKHLAAALLLIIVTLLILDFNLGRFTAQREVAGTEQRLEAEARLLAEEFQSLPREQIDAWTKRAGSRAGARVTIIDPGGVVLGDSQHDVETMENHSGRPEVVEALRTKNRGSAIRHSATLDRDLCYLAIPVVYGRKPDYILRLALPLEDLSASISAVRRRILDASLIAALVALLIAFGFSYALTRQVDRLRDFAEGLVDANLSKPPLLAGGDELGALAHSLNRMAAQLRELVARLSLENERRENILSGMMEGVLAVDKSLRVTFCNQSFARAVGSIHPVPERMPLVDLVRNPELIDALKQAVETGQPQKGRLQLTGPANRSLEIQAAPLSSPSGPGVIAILHDITDLERLERIRKDFVANVSHELRTPLTAIRGYAETLLDGALEDRQNNRRFVEIIKAHAIRLNNIALDLLVLSELESGGPPVEPERVSIREVVEAAMRTVEAEARMREVRLECGKLEKAEVLGHRMRLEQLLVNLLDNAIKFDRKGGEVKVEVTRTEDNRANIAISDTGIGIPSEDLPRIFERFYRVDKTRSREVGGTGLGLSIVKHVVERMHGTIKVESMLGKGSKFVVQFAVAGGTVDS